MKVWLSNRSPAAHEGALVLPAGACTVANVSDAAGSESGPVTVAGSLLPLDWGGITVSIPSPPATVNVATPVCGGIGPATWAARPTAAWVSNRSPANHEGAIPATACTLVAVRTKVSNDAGSESVTGK